MVNPMFITTFGNLSLCGNTKSGVRWHTVAFHGYIMWPLIMYNAIYVRSYLGKHVRHMPSVCTCIQSSKTFLFVSLLYFETNWHIMSHIKTKCYSKYNNQYSLSVAKRVYSFEIEFSIFGRIVRNIASIPWNTLNSVLMYIHTISIDIDASVFKP